MRFNPLRLLRYYYLRFIRLKGDPRSIARGVALGTFLGTTPTMPLHSISLLIFAPICRANILASFLASMAICNPLTYFPQYYFAWLIGSKITPYDLSWARISGVLSVISAHGGFKETIQSIANLGWDAVIVMLSGGVVLALPLAIIAYFVSLRFFVSLNKRKRDRHILN